MQSPSRATWVQFHDRLRAAEAERKQREPALEALENIPAAIVYSFGVRGRDLALQLRARGVRCLIFDNGEASRRRAVAEGFDLAASPNDERLPLLIGAGQNQIEIAAGLKRPAYFLAEALYGLALRNQYGPAREFTEMVLLRAEALFAVYSRLAPQSAEVFVQVLEYRASLQPAKVAARQPMGDMWRPPIADLNIASFCDIGAYDGDSLRATKAVYPQLRRSFTIEPNPELEAEITASATSLGIDNSHYLGGAWDGDTRLGARETANGMLVIEEDSQGSVSARPLDSLLGDEAFDFIKMDVEGTEARVMEGGRKSLHAARCVAVASYHLPDDLIALPARMDAIRPDWKIAFAHYSQSFDDSIFYFWR
jgi:FkbM family methyltransferase